MAFKVVSMCSLGGGSLERDLIKARASQASPHVFNVTHEGQLDHCKRQ